MIDGEIAKVHFSLLRWWQVVGVVVIAWMCGCGCRSTENFPSDVASVVSCLSISRTPATSFGPLLTFLLYYSCSSTGPVYVFVLFRFCLVETTTLQL